MGERAAKPARWVEGHFCNRCMNAIGNKEKACPTNPRRTDWCQCCHHRSEGLQSICARGEWGGCVALDEREGD